MERGKLKALVPNNERKQKKKDNPTATKIPPSQHLERNYNET